MSSRYSSYICLFSTRWSTMLRFYDVRNTSSDMWAAVHTVVMMQAVLYWHEEFVVKGGKGEQERSRLGRAMNQNWAAK
eukprot:10271487-Karenia_brevis.AAC.1